MKGNAELVDTLNSLLADELTAVNQYIVHAEMSEDWGYERLHGHFLKRSIDEMKHAERLIGRILFLESRPVVSEYRKINIGPEVPQQLENDHESEAAAIKAYNEAIRLAGDVGDFATREILESILKDEDRHINGIEELRTQIDQIGLPVFLSSQIKQEK
jgi:bacterioferritin